MKITAILGTLLLVLSISISAAPADTSYKKILGAWEFSAPNAPQPYDSGGLILKEVKSKFSGEFVIQGQSLEIPQLSFAADVLTLNFEVEGNPIELKLKLKDGVMVGTTESPDGPVTVTVKPVPKK